MNRRIRREAPPITYRTQFLIEDPPPLPTITARIAFDRVALLERRKELTTTTSFLGPSVAIQTPKHNVPPAPATQTETTDSQPSSGGKRARTSHKPPSDPCDAEVADAGGPSTSQRDRTIPKPVGEPGRPGSGGYNIRAELLGGLGIQKTDDFMAYTKARAKLHLDASASYVKQDKSKIIRVVTEVRAKFPELQNFVDNWPTYDVLKGHCKYRSSRVRNGHERPKKKRRVIFSPSVASSASSESDELESEDAP